MSRSLPRAFVLVVLCAAVPAAQSWAAPFPGFKIGDRFHYSGPPPQAPAPPANGGPVVIKVIAPTDQTITVTGEAPCGKATCLTLEARQELPSYGVGGPVAPNAGTSKARIDKATGDLVEIERVLKIAGQEQRAVTPIQSRNSLFADFYGPWMLDLRPGYKESFPLGGGGSRTYEVVGQEKVAGRECFVVRQVTAGTDAGRQEATYWIDVKGRFTVQVDRGNQRMTLQDLKSKS